MTFSFEKNGVPVVIRKKKAEHIPTWTICPAAPAPRLVAVLESHGHGSLLKP